MKISHNRFKDAPWYNKLSSPYILVGGAGGIGSWTTLLLTRAGFVPVVYDFDIVEEHNLGGQLYSQSSIGLSKVEALQTVVKNLTGDEIRIFNEKITEDSPTNKFVIAAFDNIVARRNMFRSWLANFGEDPEALFIDGRLEAEQMWIYCIKGGKDNPKDVAGREIYMDSSLFRGIPDEEAERQIADAPCTFKQTSHAAAGIAFHIVSFFTNHITNIAEKDNTREVPFAWEYFIPMNLTEITN